jgi:hypothetical protein
MNAGHTLRGMGIAVLEAFNVGGHLDDAQSERHSAPQTRDENKARDIMTWHLRARGRVVHKPSR